VGDVTDAVGNGNKSRSLCAGSRDDSRLPGELKVEGNKRPTAKQEEAEVSCGLVQCRD
jgi:hypothetical protein